MRQYGKTLATRLAMAQMLCWGGFHKERQFSMRDAIASVEPGEKPEPKPKPVTYCVPCKEETVITAGPNCTFTMHYKAPPPEPDYHAEANWKRHAKSWRKR